MIQQTGMHSNKDLRKVFRISVVASVGCPGFCLVGIKSGLHEVFRESLEWTYSSSQKA